MIKVSNLTKSFDDFKALNDLNINVKKGSIYGLVGVNGSGKTTLIKHLTGVLIPDSGEILFDGKKAYENIEIKKNIGFIPDDLFFFSIYSLKDSSRFYKSIYPNWSEARFIDMLTEFGLNEKSKLSRFSKGMQKQAAFILTMSCMPEFLILDEPIDGLDPIVRKLVWKYIVDDVADRNMTVLVSSHNLRELEGICDSIGILNKGAMMIERDLDELKSDIHKIQVAFRPESENSKEEIYGKLNILHKESRGSVDLIIVRNKKSHVEETLMSSNPFIFDVLPLSLEEIFVYELGGAQNEINQIIL